MPNVDGAGYYLARLPGESLSALLDQGWARLSRAERLAVLGDVEILVDGGQADLGLLLALLPRLGSSEDPYLLEVAIGRLDMLGRFVGQEQREPFAQLVRSTLRAAGKRIGWLPRRTEKVAEARLRGRLMTLLAVEGEDRAARDGAAALARSWLADHGKVPESLWVPVLESAVRASPKQTVPALLTRLRDEPDRVAQRAIYQAIAQATDPALQRQVLELTLTADPIPPEMVQLLRSSPVDIERQAALFDFVRDHAGDLLRRLPEQFEDALVIGVCDAARRDEVAAFLEQKVAPLPEVGTIAVAQKIEWMDQCIARRAAQAPLVAAFLAGKK